MTTQPMTAGAKFRSAMRQEKPLQVIGAINAYHARMAERSGFKAIYQAVRGEGTQKNVIESMQTRNELYDYLDYHSYETKLDQLFAKEKS